jgi:integration host factor subunit beta
MNKIDLIQSLKNSNHLSKSEAEKIVALFFNQIADALVQGDRVEIRGLCSIFVKKYRGYTGRNPKTGEKVKIKPKKLPFFKAGKELKDRVDEI